MNPPKVSIIVPVYNVERYLSRCMDSLLNQTLYDIEIILVDDGSPDKCPELCDEYARKDNRVVVCHKKNGGLGFARNSGLELARGEFVAFVDSDDYIDIETYQILYSKAKELELDTVFFGFNKVTDDLRILPVMEVGSLQIFNTPKEIMTVLSDMIGSEPYSSADRTYQVSTCYAIYSKFIIDKFNLRFHSERELISEDMIFNIDYLQKAQNIAFVPGVNYYYCANEGSLSGTYRFDRFEKYKILHAEVCNRIGSIENITNYLQRVDRLFIGYSRSLILSISKYNLSTIEKQSLLGELCSDPIWKIIFERYPYNKLPLKHRIVVIGIKYKLTNMLLIISKLTNHIR